ncbi:MFS general substrate transporter [Trametes sanguinea]|nr:MFS general substrate transporter [Trametes sanguinea]
MAVSAAHISSERSLKAAVDIECISLQGRARTATGLIDSCSSVIDVDEERRLWRRVDLQLIPLVTVMYLVAFIDKTNIGNAKIQGLTTQLNLTGNRFNIILTLNFVTNCVFALPANLLLKKLRPSVWLPGITIIWGIITYITVSQCFTGSLTCEFFVSTLQGIVKSYQQLLALRVCLGIAEAGLSPGILYYLTLWYPRYMLQYRIGLFWGGAAFAGAFSGLLAYGISFMAGIGGLEGWSWIFILEGIISVVVGVVAAFIFVDYPQTADFLKPKEKAYLVHRTTYDTLSAGEDPDFSIHLWNLPLSAIYHQWVWIWASHIPASKRSAVCDCHGHGSSVGYLV